MAILVTGGAGFVGSSFVIEWLAETDETVVNLDRLTYAGNLNNLVTLEENALHIFVKGDIGGLNEKTNIEIVHTLCDILGELRPLSESDDITSYRDLIAYVKDRPGHDRRYAIDATKLKTELDWHPAGTFESGIRKTVSWYLDNSAWVERVISGEYRQWIERQYA